MGDPPRTPNGPAAFARPQHERQIKVVGYGKASVWMLVGE